MNVHEVDVNNKALLKAGGREGVCFTSDPLRTDLKSRSEKG